MYYVKPSATLVKEYNPTKKIESAYRICYKSEEHMKEGSEKLITRILSGNGTKCHTSPLGHVWVDIDLYEQIYYDIIEACLNYPALWNMEQFFKTNGVVPNEHYLTMTTNFRALFTLFKQTDLIEHNHDIKILAQRLHNIAPIIFTEEYPDCDIEHAHVGDIALSDNYFTFKVVTTRDILQEIARHTAFCLSVESTRYCNYNKKGMVFTLPYGLPEFDNINAYLELADGETDMYVRSLYPPAKLDIVHYYLNSMCRSQETYNRVIEEHGCTPQLARMFLPGALKTELYMTGSREAWDNFLTLRCDSASHPQIQYIANQIKEQLI